MNSQQVSDLKLLYNAVYDENLREQAEEYNNTVFDEDIVEVATEYFYTYGLNEDGVNILIEKVGLDNFIEFVYSLSEDLTVLNEARKTSKAKKTEGSFRTRQAAKLEAQKAARKAAQERTEIERKEPESKGADTEAKAEQPTRRPIRDAIARQVLAGMERHRKAMELARETGKTVAKTVAVTHEAGRRAGEHVKKYGLKSLANEEFEGDLFDYLLEYLVAEGYADTNQDALVIMASMTQDDINDFITERRRVEKGNPRTEEPSAAFRQVSASMGAGRMGVEPRGVKKQKGSPIEQPESPVERFKRDRAYQTKTSQELQNDTRRT